MYIFWRKHVHVLTERSLQFFGCGLGNAKTALFPVRSSAVFASGKQEK